MRMHAAIWVSAFMGLLVLPACSWLDPEETEPAYLYLQPFQVTTSIGSQGTANQKITEGWLFVDDVFLGAYDLPAEVPVLAAGPTTIRLEAGIRDNGISVQPDIYPFFDPYSVDLDLMPGRFDTLRPVATYSNKARFAFIEDFEDARPRIFTERLTGQATLTRTTTEVFEGAYSGHIQLTEDQPIIELATSAPVGNLFAGGFMAYLEINYKTDVPVIFGLVGQRQGGMLERYYDPGFLPKDEWNKIYLNLTSAIYAADLDEYRVAFQAALPDGLDVGNIYLDNIKLLHF